jgi:hypothetical protein
VAYTDDVNLPGDYIDTIKKNTEILIHANEEVCLEINVEKLSKYHWIVSRMRIKLVT